MPVRTMQLPLSGLDDHDSVELDDVFVPNLRNVRSDRSRIVQAPGGTLMAPAPIPSGASSFGIVVGSFVKATATGNQTITHTLNTTPQALMMWTDAAAASVVTNALYLAHGFTDGTTSRSIAMASKDNAGTSNTSKRYAAKLLTVVEWSETLLYECDWVSWSASDFVVNWTTNNANSDRIYYLLIGGSGISATVIDWTTNTGVGNQAVTGTAFTPQAVIHLFNSSTAAGSTADGRHGIGVMTGATAQWSISEADRDAQDTTSCQRVRTTDATISMTSFGGANPDYTASFVSLNGNGFTVNWTRAPSSAFEVASLCIAGLGNVKAGSFVKTTAAAPVTQAVTGVGFQPNALLFGWAAGTSGTSPVSGIHYSLGASDNISSGVITAESENGVGTSNTVTEGLTNGVVLDINTSGTTRLLGGINTLDTDGFTMKWTTNNGNSDTIFYIALQFSSAIPGQIGVIRNYLQPIVAGTPVEKIIMLTSKSAWVYAASTSSTGVFGPTAEVYTGTDVQRFGIANTLQLAAWSQGKDNIRSYDGTTFAALISSGTNHAARTLLAFNNRIISVRPLVAGVDQKTQIRWCINGTLTDWAGLGSGTLEVVETSNQPLTGGIVLGERCYLTRAREVIELIATGTLSPVFRTETRVSGIGCISTHSMAAGDIYAFWLGPDEIYQWDGAQLKAVGGRIYNTITNLIDYSNLDQIQGTVYSPDSQYWLVIPPYVFVYDYRRDIWDWDDIRSFQAIATLRVGDLFTADINHSEFVVIGDSSVQTIREDPSINTYLGAPIDSYFETKDLLPLEQAGQRYDVSYDKYNSIWRVWFRGTPGEVIEVAVSTDKGLTYPAVNMQTVTVNAAGVGIAFFDLAWGVLRIRIRSQTGSVYTISGPIQIEWAEAGTMLP